MLSLAIEKTLRSRLLTFKLDVAFNLGEKYRRAVFFGPSGSGKTLTMQCIAGLARPDKGFISVMGKELYNSTKKLNIPPQKRRIGYMLQNYALFPQFTVLQNVAYPRSGIWAWHINKEQKTEALAVLERFGIATYRRHYPAELSGGQKQRVALARAVNSNPGLMLLDEPFSALDPLLRQHLRSEMLDILNQLGTEDDRCPVIIITHDPDDVDAFAGCLILFHKGKARVVENWRELRTNFPSASACLNHLQQEAWGQ